MYLKLIGTIFQKPRSHFSIYFGPNLMSIETMGTCNELSYFHKDFKFWFHFNHFYPKSHWPKIYTVNYLYNTNENPNLIEEITEKQLKLCQTYAGLIPLTIFQLFLELKYWFVFTHLNKSD